MELFDVIRNVFKYSNCNMCFVLYEWPLILYIFLTNDVRVFKTTKNFSFKFEPVGDVALAVGLVQLLDGPRRPVHSHARRTLVQEHLHS